MKLATQTSPLPLVLHFRSYYPAHFTMKEIGLKYFLVFSEVEKPSTTTQPYFSDYDVRTEGEWKFFFLQQLFSGEDSC